MWGGGRGAGGTAVLSKNFNKEGYRSNIIKGCSFFTTASTFAKMQE